MTYDRFVMSILERVQKGVGTLCLYLSIQR